MSDTPRKPTGPHDRDWKAELPQNILAGLTVSFAAISLGAAFGIQSGREDGILIGILSAGVIAFITSLLGGTRIQCSGPTAPMTTVTVTIVAFAVAAMAGDSAQSSDKAIEVFQTYDYITANHFITLVLLMTAGLLLLMALLRLGKYITLVPPVVISGFMNGIAILIWIGEVKKLFFRERCVIGDTVTACPKEVPAGVEVVTGYTGGLAMNVGIALITLVMLFTLPKLINATVPKFKSFLPGTLITIIVVTVVVNLAQLGVETPNITAELKSFEDLKALYSKQVPAGEHGGYGALFHMDLVMLALPFALNLTLLAYLDTLLTSLVVDKKVKETFGYTDDTLQNKELVAQGLANGAVAFIGGIPGAQATIRSVLILKENATIRLAGILSGAFVIVEMVLFQDLVGSIPTSVFAGLLIKVGYDVMDWDPIIAWTKGKMGKIKASVSDIDMFFIAGTTGITAVFGLNEAVISFTILYYVLRKLKPELIQSSEESA